MEYLIFEKAEVNKYTKNPAYIQTDVEPFESHWEAQKWIENKCLNSSKQLSDFRIFMDYSVTD
ncbi:MAG TPA: hypothetical protein H9746_00825 [Candidatus Butyricicoccus avistercoris]|uniref:Uncharacterized protein n=1 Tax=Candidatus Butyricicoccus avistercoris TaxID=2838518 RepID=A0A9D1PHA0_9FIRM|nr:hypothetical protein [Candidatus Butyricicoccus avistercoris]